MQLYLRNNHKENFSRQCSFYFLLLHVNDAEQEKQ